MYKLAIKSKFKFPNQQFQHYISKEKQNLFVDDKLSILDTIILLNIIFSLFLGTNYAE